MWEDTFPKTTCSLEHTYEAVANATERKAEDIHYNSLFPESLPYTNL